MAAGGGHRLPSKGRKRLLFVEERRMMDGSCNTCLVFKINLKDMFAPAAGEDGDEEDWAAAMWSFPQPVAQFDALPGRPERLDLAIVSGVVGGTKIVAVSSHRRTFIYDVAANTELPCRLELRCSIPNGTTLIPLGTRLYAVPTNPRPPTNHSHPSFQALLPPAQLSSHGRWSWRSLPAPPRDMYRMGSLREKAFCYVAASLAVGTRVWVSAPDRGTFSFDTARLVWRKEGDWELPFHRRALFVPDLGLCFGICPLRLCLCAFDVPTTGAGEPPAVRYVWQDESYPREVGDKGFTMDPSGSSLAYMGDGKFCIAWTIAVEYSDGCVISRYALFLMAVQAVRQSAASAGPEELRLVKHKVRCYKMASSGANGYVLRPSLG